MIKQSSGNNLAEWLSCCWVAAEDESNPSFGGSQLIRRGPRRTQAAAAPWDKHPQTTAATALRPPDKKPLSLGGQRSKPCEKSSQNSTSPCWPSSQSRQHRHVSGARTSVKHGGSRKLAQPGVSRLQGMTGETQRINWEGSLGPGYNLHRESLSRRTWPI